MIIDGKDIGVVRTTAIRYDDGIGLVFECKAEHLENPFSLYIPSSVVQTIVRIKNKDAFSSSRDERSFKEILDQNPGLADYLVDLFDRFIKVNDEIDDLNKKYPIDGYIWDIDPNWAYIEEFREDKCVDNVCISLTSDSSREKMIDTFDDIIANQIDCSKGIHKWINVAGVKWCKFCGAIQYPEYGIIDHDFVITEQKLKLPSYPPFLPKQTDEVSDNV